MARKPQREKPSSTGGADADLALDEKDMTPHDKFWALARRLARTNRDELVKKERDYADAKKRFD